MQRLSYFLIGTGFFWILVWSVFGSLLGVQLTNMAAAGILESKTMLWQRNLLGSLHAHMNLMGITTILLGVTLKSLSNCWNQKLLKTLALSNIFSIPIFGLGLSFKAFYYPEQGNTLWLTSLTALGGSIYLICLAVWASLFIVLACISSPKRSEKL